MTTQTDRRRALAALSLLSVLPAVSPAQPAVPDAGIDYRELKPALPSAAGRRIEVIDFFWYGCPHCARFEPELEAWRKRQGADIAYVRSPVDFDQPGRMLHARLYHALEALGRAEELHPKLFELILGDRRLLTSPTADGIADAMASLGIDRRQWREAFDGFSTVTRARRSAQLWKDYRIDGTPAVGIHGRYVTSPSMVAGRMRAIAVVDHLVARLRSASGAVPGRG